MTALRTLLAGVVDYAGLFPPAALPMRDAVLQYAAARSGTHGWMLGRFVVSIARLPELAAVVDHLSAADRAAGPWRLSGLVGPDVDADARAARAFIAGTGPGAALTLDAFELKVASPGDIAAAMAALPPGCVVAFEVAPAAGTPAAVFHAIRDAGGIAKLRTGGVTPEAIPSVAVVAGFIRACLAAGVPFKATAGLHHPVRAAHPLTDEPGSPTAVMHGFLNVFVAAACAAAGTDCLEDILMETDPAQFRVDADSIGWRHVRVPLAVVRQARATAALSFGSCSFAEPVADLQRMGWLDS